MFSVTLGFYGYSFFPSRLKAFLTMAPVCCLVGAAPQHLPRLAASIIAALGDVEITIAFFDVVMLHALDPAVIVVDIDSVKMEPVEALRQLRFALPNCTLAVYAETLRSSQLPGLRNAGANALISKTSTDAATTAGLRRALASGNFIDPSFAAGGCNIRKDDDTHL